MRLHDVTAPFVERAIVETRAVLSANDEVPEATSTSENAAANLCRAALAVDRARRQEKCDADAALGYWKAMLDGEWSLVERFESDGRRILLARPNSPTTRKHHALTENERKVVSQIVRCRPAKLVAYELCTSESVVSMALGSALRKLGLRNSSELIELHGAIVDEPWLTPRWCRY